MVSTELTQHEQAVLAVFASDLRKGGTGTLKLSEILGSEGESDARRKAIRNLSSRGWLVVGSAMHWGQDDQCVLLGEGLRRARAMATE
jgi:hypothetical protein